MKTYVAEAIGTFILVLFGCGAAVFAGTEIGFLGIAFAFGLALITAAYFIGGISGCHINPAVSVGMYAAGRMKMGDLIGYVIGQFAGAFVAGFVLLLIAKGKLAGYDVGASGLGQNGWGAGYLGEFGFFSAFLFELIATFIFVALILAITENASMSVIAGLIIGLALVVIHIVGIPVTGVSVNPARSFGPAFWSGNGSAWLALPLFLTVPTAAGFLAGILNKTGILSTKDDDGAGERTLNELADRVKDMAGNLTKGRSDKRGDDAKEIVADATEAVADKAAKAK
ncbi:MAG: aquaporin [Geminicoccaceae bacterium]